MKIDLVIIDPQNDFCFPDMTDEIKDFQHDHVGVDDRLEKLILYNAKGNTKEITLAILDDVKKFAIGAEQSDDITIMVLRFY